MPTWTPDPTFYPSPRMAMKAPAEKLAYVASFDPTRRVPDAITVVDVDPGSATYSRVIGTVAMPNTGDELHHFGWNACSSCLCPNAPHPHSERRYLVVPGLRSSRIHILDTKANPREPSIVRVLEPEEVAERSGYTRPHTIHCGPEGIYVAALGNARGEAPGGVFLMDHETFDIRGRWEIDRGPQQLAYDAWWHLGHDTLVTSEWGLPATFENGLVPEILLGGKYGHRLHFWDLHARKHIQEVDFGAENQLVFELRPAHDPTKAYGFVNSVISLKNLSASIWTWYRENGAWAARKIIEIPAEPADPELLPPILKSFAAVPPFVTDIDLSMDDRFLYVACWGTGDLRQYRRVRPVCTEARRNGQDRRRRLAREPSQGRQRQAQWRAADGRDQPRRAARLFHQLALRGDRRAALSRGTRRLDGEARRRGRGGDRARPELLPRVAEDAPAPSGAPRRRRLLIGLLLLSMKPEPAPSPASAHAGWR